MKQPVKREHARRWSHSRFLPPFCVRRRGRAEL